MDAKDKLISEIKELKEKLDLKKDNDVFKLKQDDIEYLTTVLLCEIDKARKIVPDEEIAKKNSKTVKKKQIVDKRIYDEKFKTSRIDKKV